MQSKLRFQVNTIVILYHQTVYNIKLSQFKWAMRTSNLTQDNPVIGVIADPIYYFNRWIKKQSWLISMRK